MVGGAQKPLSNPEKCSKKQINCRDTFLRCKVYGKIKIVMNWIVLDMFTRGISRKMAYRPFFGLQVAKNTYLAKNGKNEFFREKVTHHHLGTTKRHNISKNQKNPIVSRGWCQMCPHSHIFVLRRNMDNEI